MGGFGVPCSRFGNYHDHFGLQQEFRLVFRLKKGPDKLARTGPPGRLRSRETCHDFRFILCWALIPLAHDKREQ